MDFEELKRELESIDETIEQAKESLQDRDYAHAQSRLKTALELLEVSHPEDHPHYILCLRLLGESCYALSEYSEAAQYFAQVIEIKEKHPTLPVNNTTLYFQLAHSLEKAGKPQEALVNYEKLLLDSEGQMPLGEALHKIILESYAKCLRTLGKTPVEIDRELKKVGKLSRTAQKRLAKQSRKAKESLVGDLSSNNSELKRLEHFLSFDGKGNLSELRLRNLASPPGKKIKAIACAVMAAAAVIPVFGLILYTMQKTAMVTGNIVKKEEAQLSLSKLAAKLSGKSFSTLDHRLSISFEPGGQAKVTEGAKTTSALCFDKDAATQIFDRKFRLFKIQGENLLTDERIPLYQNSSPEFGTVEKMEKIAVAIGEYYQLNSAYPENDQELLPLIAGKVDLSAGGYSFQYIGRFNTDAEMHAAIASLSTLDAVTGEQALPDAIYLDYALSGDAQSGLKCPLMIMRARDHAGAVLRGSLPEQAYTIAFLKGTRITHTPAGEDQKQDSQNNQPVQAISLEEI